MDDANIMVQLSVFMKSGFQMRPINLRPWFVMVEIRFCKPFKTGTVLIPKTNEINSNMSPQKGYFLIRLINFTTL